MTTQWSPGLIQPVGDQFGMLEVMPQAVTLSSFSVAATPADVSVLIGVTATVRAQLYTGSVNAGLTTVPGATCTFVLDVVTTPGYPYSCSASTSAPIAAGQLAVVLFTLTTSTSSGQPLSLSLPLYVSTGLTGS